MKQLKLTFLLTVLMSMVGIKVHAETIYCDISVENEDGVTIYYLWINNHTELSVYRKTNYYKNSYTGALVSG